MRRTNPGNQGSKHPNSLLKEEDVIDILRMLKNGYRSKTLALLYNVDVSTISYLKCGKSWKHIDRNDYSINVATSKLKILKGRHKKLTDAQVSDILERLNIGEKQAYIAELYGVSSPTISNINCGAIWKHIARKPNARIRIAKTAHMHTSKIKLNEEIIKDIRKRLADGERQHKVAIHYNITQATVSLIHRGLIWKRVQ